MNNYSEVSRGSDILIVDDTLENLRLLSMILKREGYSVRKALNGAMALTAAQTMPPDLILLDIMMPGLNGYQVCQELKANPQTAKIPIVFLSALSDGNDKVQAFTLGAADYITKPFQMEEVLARVRNQLALRDAEIRNQLLNTQLEQRVKERTAQLEATNQELQQEIAERQLLQSQLLEMAYYDRLTGLPNQALFIKRLEQAIARAQSETTYRFAVLTLDCDRFRMVNDSLGHRIGDQLLLAVARRLATMLYQNQGYTLARLGGDEFAILLEDLTASDGVTDVADQIQRLLVQPFQLEQHEVFINASIGIAVGGSQYNKPEHLLWDADTALHRAKDAGKARYEVFNPAMHEAALQLLRLETDLRRAVNHQEFVAHYQPIVDLISGKITGFEALVRWQHPDRGLISPGVFVPIAEEVGLIGQIGIGVLREACNQLHQWHHLELQDKLLSMSVNLSAQQFAQPDLVKQIDQVLAETQVSPDCLKLEITESAIMDNPRSAASILQQLRDRKIQLSIDDFGTGYSSLSYLNSFPVDTLKVDRSFVRQMNGSPETLGLTPLIINIAHTMGMTVTAEGIETPQQLEQLRSLNCNFGQGYLFAKPLEATQATQLIATDPWW
jgi:diguanylate cyclase (GGDEF)-like protein